ncbi:MAG: hypothetical protein ACREI8_11655 [Myxococcota bacterium]
MRLAAGLALAGLLGCMSPVELDSAVLEYDRAVNRVEAELLLLNIARARHHRPIHFTAVSSIAATYDFRLDAAAIGRFGPSPDDAPVDVLFGASFAENPTITIVPISGQEFTTRVLRPLEEPQFHAEFRRHALHLAALSARRELFVQRIGYEESRPVPLAGGPTAADALAAAQEGYRWSRAGGGSYQLTRRVPGRLLLANFDAALLSNAERAALDAEARRLPASFVRIDVRTGYPGGDYPLRGWIALRSLSSILVFLARGIAEQPEFAVEPDPRSGPAAINPVRTLEIGEGDAVPRDAEFAVEIDDRHYWIRKLPVSEGMVSSWNQQAFAVLTNLFQMTVTDVSATPAPVISIPK